MTVRRVLWAWLNEGGSRTAAVAELDDAAEIATEDVWNDICHVIDVAQIVDWVSTRSGEILWAVSGVQL